MCQKGTQILLAFLGFHYSEKELDWAIRLITEHADEWLIEENKIFLCKLLVGKNTPEEGDKKYLNLNEQVTENTPPLFVFTTGEDVLPRRMTLDLIRAYGMHSLTYNAPPVR